jgi:hypothetical protein
MLILLTWVILGGAMKLNVSDNAEHNARLIVQLNRNVVELSLYGDRAR